jgi:isoquinoline 1-oxidoreductase subunit beta
MVDGIYNQSYRLPHFVVETVDTPLPIPVYFMRSVGSTAAVFFWESFITELAQRAQIDQYAYRRNLLSDPLALRVLDAAAQASGWGSSTDTFRGIAFNCYVASPRGSSSSASSVRSTPLLWSTRTRSRLRSRAASGLR